MLFIEIFCIKTTQSHLNELFIQLKIYLIYIQFFEELKK